MQPLDWPHDTNLMYLFVMVENSVAKAEIAYYEQFLYVPQCF